MYLEAVLVLHQLRLMQNAKLVEPFTTPYVFALGAARFLGFAHYIIQVSVIDPADMNSLERALDQHKVSPFSMESPTNPFLRCIDVKFVSELCHNKGALVCIDDTFASHVNQNALTMGADRVVHATT